MKRNILHRITYTHVFFVILKVTHVIQVMKRLSYVLSTLDNRIKDWPGCIMVTNRFFCLHKHELPQLLTCHFHIVKSGDKLL